MNDTCGMCTWKMKIKKLATEYGIEWKQKREKSMPESWYFWNQGKEKVSVTVEEKICFNKR